MPQLVGELQERERAAGVPDVEQVERVLGVRRRDEPGEVGLTAPRCGVREGRRGEERVGQVPAGPQVPEIRALTIWTPVASDRWPASSSKIFLNVGMAWT